MKAFVAVLIACAAMNAQADGFADVLAEAKAAAAVAQMKKEPLCAYAGAIAIKTVMYRQNGLSVEEIQARVDKFVPQLEDRNLVAHRVVRRMFGLTEQQINMNTQADFAMLGMDICQFHKDTGT